MQFDEFILSKLIRQDIAYVSCRFSHLSNDLQMDNLSRAIREEGYNRNYTDDRITRERNAVINMLDQYRQRKHRNVFHFEIEDHLPLGGIFELKGQLSDFHDNYELTLMRVGHNMFMVIESNHPSVFHLFSIYRLESKTYFSTIKGETPDPYVFLHEGNRLPIIIQSLNLLSPSIVEQLIDGKNLPYSEPSRLSNYILHDSPMSLLFHDFSSQLSKYVDISYGQSVSSSAGNKPIDDMIDFINALKIYISGSSPDEVVRKYPEWLQFCKINGLSVMTLDELVNLFWDSRQ